MPQSRDRYFTPEYRQASRERAKAWRLANPRRQDELVKAWHQTNRDKRAEHRQRWEEKHPLSRRERTTTYRARKLGAVISRADYAAILGAFGPYCHICGEEIREKLQFDHVIPLAAGGAHAKDNLRPAHAFCNQSKGDRL